MLKTIKLLVLAATLAGAASGALAASVPQQDQTAWFIDSGRYIDGQVPPVPSYPGALQNRPLAEGRNAAVIGRHSAQASTMSRNLKMQ
jgi:hypothetical protein